MMTSMIRSAVLATGLATIALAGGCAVGTEAEEIPVAETAYGTVLGLSEGNLDVYRGIPYAAPPVGDLRFRPPHQPQRWDGLLAADKFGPACIQPVRGAASGSIYANPAMTELSEDCLSLNIWAPEGAARAPVLVWIHGGALRTGSSSEAMYDGSGLAGQGLVVVSINYRVGVLGWLAHPELSAESPDGVSGNYGLLDQIAALEWIAGNIEAFGGDPDNVTIAGESGGALSVMYLMASPQAHGLFDKAIAQSAYMITNPALNEARFGMPSAEGIGSYLVAGLGKTGIADLRAMDAEELYAAAAAAGFAPWGTIDGVVLPDEIVNVFDAGKQAPIPILTGFNSGEIRSLRVLAPTVPESAEAYEATIRELYGDMAGAFLALYPSSDLEGSILAAPRDSLYGWTSNRLVRKQEALGHPSFLYLFDHGYPAADDNGLHGFHAAEIPYVFGTIDNTPPFWPAIPETDVEQDLSRAMMGYWASFARDGVPSAEGVAAWPAFGTDKAYMAFEKTPVPGEDLMPGMFELHEETMCRRRAEGTQAWNWNTGIASPVLPAETESCK